MSEKILGNLEKGLLFVVSAPAGTGKTTLVEMLLNEFPDAIAESCSSTTRPPRPGEIAERHYEFISEEEFQKRIERKEFLEYAKVFGNYYGTRIEEINNLQSSGKHVILVIDTQGALQIMGKVEAIFIFIEPPSMEELRNRLFKRRTEDEKKIQERLGWAKEELKVAMKYDYRIVNDRLDVTYEILKSILITEEQKAKNKQL